MTDEIKVLVKYWHSKGYEAKKMHEKCLKHFPNVTVGYSTITNWIRRLDSGENIIDRKIGSGRLSDGLVDIKIIEELEITPFHSVRTLNQALKIPTTTIFYHLRNMGYVIKHLKYVPHNLTQTHKNERVRISKLMLETLKQAKHQGWTFFLTGDESWFFLDSDYELQWVHEDEKPAERPKRLISAKKCMITIFFSPLGFRVINMLPQKTTFTSQYFIDEILVKITKTHPPQVQRDPKRRVRLHFDNARPHKTNAVLQFCNNNGLSICEHPPYSPDLAPSDFYLFGMIKQKLKGRKFDSENELFNAIVEILKCVSKEELISVFKNWKGRLKQCITQKGEYID